MSDIKFSAGIVFFCVAASGFAASSPVGSWTGHLQLVASPKATPQQKQGIAKYMTMAAKSHISLNLKANHSFVSDVTGARPQHKEGTWNIKGNSVILVTKQGSQPFKISADGKTMSFPLPTIPGVTGTVTFTR